MRPLYTVALSLIVLIASYFTGGPNRLEELDRLNERLRRIGLGLSIDDNSQFPIENDRYRRLSHLLDVYLRVYEGGGWPLVSAECESGELIARLRLAGDLENERIEKSYGSSSGADVESALKSFQNRYGLTPDGRCGPETIAALNVPARSRIMQILANLERWHTPSYDLEDHYLEINIPAYSASLVRDGVVTTTLRAIVGRASQPTPMLRSTITDVSLNPFWEVPRSIASKEILPKLKRDSGYLEKHQMQLFTLNDQRLDPSAIDWGQVSPRTFPFHIHQVPGPWNALGNMKFAFPNHYGVFLHGTANPELFNEHRRSLSHGCVRVEDPLSIAEAVLEGTPWTRAALVEALASGRTQKITAREPFPIYLAYWTVWVDEQGLPHFTNDPYGLDAKALAR